MRTSTAPTRPSGRNRFKLAFLLAMGMALGACGGGKGGGQEPKTPAPPPEPTPQEKIAQLEEKGQLPQLERLPLVAGIDLDNDGVRDDIGEHIRRTYTEPVQYRAAMQMARVHQAMLLVDKHDHIALQEVSERSMKAIACLHQVFSLGDGPPEGTRVREEIRSMTTNTKERLQTYLAYNKARSGSISVRPEGSVCE
jgi:hypothetical protein